MQSIRAPAPRDFAKLTLLGAIWASAFMCIEVALADFSPLAIAGWRIAIATCALAPLVLLRREPWPRGARTWGLILLAGALYNAIPFTLISWGQQFITSGLTAILMSSGPFAALVLSHFLTRDDRLTAFKLGAVLLGFAGVVVLIGAQAVSGGAANIGGSLAMVAAVSCYVLSSLVVRRIVGVSPLALSLAVLAGSCTYMVPIVAVVSDPFPELSGRGPLAALVFLGLVPTAFAYILRIQIAQQVGAIFLSQVSYLIPPFGLFLSWLFLEQVPAPSSYVALTLILGGLIASRYAARADR